MIGEEIERGKGHESIGEGVSEMNLPHSTGFLKIKWIKKTAVDLGESKRVNISLEISWNRSMISESGCICNLKGMVRVVI